MATAPTPSDIQLFGGDTAASAVHRRKWFFLLFLALAASLVLLWFATHNPVVVSAFGAGLIGLCGLAAYCQANRPVQQAAEALPPDWSITRDTADLAMAAVAISDRAGRLVCANGLFGKWFEGMSAPPNLDVDEAGQQMLVELARRAWRDGEAQMEAIKRDETEYSVRALRSGTGDEYLLWWIAPSEQVDVETRSSEFVKGRLGRALALSGVMAASIGGEGRIRAANAAFALRATGDDNSNMVGQDVADLLRIDEKGVIYFDREGRSGLPIRMVHVPLSQDNLDGASLLLLVDDKATSIDRQSALTHVQNMLSTLPLGLALADRDGRFIFANDSFAHVVNIPPDNLPPYPGDLVIKEDKAAVAESIRRYSRGAAMTGDIAVRLKGAPDDVIALSISGVRGLGDAAVLIGLKDNSEETKLKRQITQASKMQSIGQLAGGVAHDFNNILTAIIGYCDLMMLRHQPGDSDYDDIQQIKSNSNRAASLTRQLLAFSRQQTLRPQILQLPDVVVEVSSLLKRLLGEKIRFEVNHGRNLGSVRADPGQLEQVIINLGVNARDAMPDGGLLHMETRAVTQADVREMGSDILPIADYVLLTVEDTGSGISAENMAKIFEPFFTTKEVGKGTGLGLSTVYGIVKQSGGFIFADSEVGKGTRFDIYLPVHEGDTKALAEPKQPAAKKEPLWGNGKILVVEDEDMVRAVAERALVRQGYVVETASDGEEALDLFADGKRYDLIVSDVVMPNMDGPAMGRALRKKYGDMRILFMSGYAEEQLRESIDIENVFFLPKPFSVQDISEAVRDAISS